MKTLLLIYASDLKTSEKVTDASEQVPDALAFPLTAFPFIYPS